MNQPIFGVYVDIDYKTAKKFLEYDHPYFNVQMDDIDDTYQQIHAYSHSKMNNLKCYIDIYYRTEYDEYVGNIYNGLIFNFDPDDSKKAKIFKQHLSNFFGKNKVYSGFGSLWV